MVYLYPFNFAWSIRDLYGWHLLPVAYTYMNEIANTTWSYTTVGEFAVFLMQCGSAAHKVVSSIIPTSSFNIEYNAVMTNVENNKNIDLSDYDNIVVDTSCLSDDARIIVEKVVHIANNPDLYSGYDVTIELDRHISIEEYTEATGFLMIYFGIEEEDVFDINSDVPKSKPSTLTITLDKIEKFEAHRVNNVILLRLLYCCWCLGVNEKRTVSRLIAPDSSLIL